MRLRINLATRRYVNTRAINLALGALCALLAVALLFQLQDAAYTAGEIKRLKAGTATASAKAPRVQQVTDEQYRQLMEKVHAANLMIDQKSLDWVTLLDNLETVVPEGVALSSIEPDMKGKTVRLLGVARSFSNLRTLLENLESSRYFSEVYLLTQQQTKVGLTQQGITFSVTCTARQL